MPGVQKIPSPFVKRRFMPSSAKAGPVSAGRSVAGLKPFAGSKAPKRIILYAYCAFVFSLPFEMAEVEVAGGLVTVVKISRLSFCYTYASSTIALFQKTAKGSLVFCGLSGDFCHCGVFRSSGPAGRPGVAEIASFAFFFADSNARSFLDQLQPDA